MFSEVCHIRVEDTKESLITSYSRVCLSEKAGFQLAKTVQVKHCFFPTRRILTFK